MINLKKIYGIVSIGMMGFVSIPLSGQSFEANSDMKSATILSVQSASSILDQVHIHYNSTNNLKIDFSLSYKNANSSQFSSPENGEIWVSPKSNKYKIVMENNEYVSDGKSQWAILKDIEEIQITEIVNSSAGQIAPSNLFSFFQTGFTSKVLKSETVQNKNVWNIELKPEKSNLPYQKVIIRVVKNTNEIHDITIFDKNNGEMKYAIKSVQKLTQMNPTLFQFDKNKYKNMEIVDLR